MTGYIYFAIMFVADDDGYVKIGYSKNPDERIANLSTATPFDIYFELVLKGSKESEKMLHRLLKPHHISREWFRLTSEMGDFIDDMADAALVLTFKHGDDYVGTVEECLPIKDRAKETIDGMIGSIRTLAPHPLDRPPFLEPTPRPEGTPA